MPCGRCPAISQTSWLFSGRLPKPSPSPRPTCRLLWARWWPKHRHRPRSKSTCMRTLGHRLLRMPSSPRSQPLDGWRLCSRPRSSNPSGSQARRLRRTGRRSPERWPPWSSAEPATAAPHGRCPSSPRSWRCSCTTPRIGEAPSPSTSPPTRGFSPRSGRSSVASPPPRRPWPCFCLGRSACCASVASPAFALERLVMSPSSQMWRCEWGARLLPTWRWCRPPPGWRRYFWTRRVPTWPRQPRPEGGCRV
mmetsp:Transcript_158823/g.509176  ORF Transcript_158823/g.509176 Transcript_158823/m.509176 type:complete len:250 (+) Transcript_158823:941-1690(+)